MPPFARFAVFATLAGCPGGGEDWQPVVYTDVGEVCFAQSGGDVAVTVTVSDCMSSSCTRNFEGACTGSVTGTEVALTSDISWEEDVGAEECTADCGIPMATCTLAGLADGTYTVTFGDRTLELVVPVVGDCETL